MRTGRVDSRPVVRGDRPPSHFLKSQEASTKSILPSPSMRFRRKGSSQPAPTRGFSWYFESVACRCPWYFASPFELYGRSARSVV